MSRNVRALSCPPGAVFDVLANGWLYPAWVVGASRMRDVDASWPAVGAQLHHSFGVWPALIDDATVLEVWDPPHGATLRARGWPMGEARVRLDVRPVPGGCLVRLQEEAIRGPGRLMPRPVADLALHWRNAETLQRLAFLAEARAR